MKTLGGPPGSKLLWVVALLVPVAAGAQSLPSASQVADKIAVGLNIGNTLEATGGETAWGNPLISQKLIDGVKAAGFNAVRLPCAWDGHADASTHLINAAWMARVKQVVDYCVNDGLYVVLNIHWDGGWLENHVTTGDQAKVNEKQKAYWTQIATTFKGYDEHLLFAGTNEVHQNYDKPSSENIAVQQSYNQTFVDAVRATGGNNATRPLVVQTYNTNIGHGLEYFTLPKDTAANRLIVEVHYYDPWGFTGSEDSNACLYWGSPYPAQSACSWAQESYLDDQFSKVKAKWVSQGIPVIIGEYGAMRRSLSGQQLNDHLASRRYYHKYLNTSANRNGIKTFLWDIGVNGLFDRNSGSVVDQAGVDAILQGAGVTPPPVGTSALTVTRAGSGSGTVSSSPSGIACGSTCAASFSAGVSVALTAAADGGSTFAGWSGACSGTGTCTVSMSSARTVTATFNRSSGTTNALTVTRAGSGSGTVSSSPSGIACGSTCSASFSAGASVELTAAADGGSTFAGWSGACSGTGTCTASMSSAQTVTATFDRSSGTTNALTVTRAGSGSGTVSSSPSGIACGSTCAASFSGGTTVTLTATADSGSTFGGWSGACSGTGTCTVTMNSAQSATATFSTTVPGFGCATGGSGSGPRLALLLPSLAALLLRRRRSAVPPAATTSSR
jgi:endoglucanase